MRKRLYLTPIVALLLFGCGSGSESGKTFSPQGGHPDEWANPLYIGRDVFHATAVEELPPSPEGGLFLLHCAPCHGQNAGGKIGPDIRGVSLPLITAAIQNIPLMRGHSVLTQTELQSIADYLSALAQNVQPVFAVFRTDVCMECHGNDLDGGIAKASCHSCHNGPEGDVGHPSGWRDSKNDPAHFHGRYGNEFKASCATCHGFDLNGYIAPACSSCHDGQTAPLLNPFSLSN